MATHSADTMQRKTRQRAAIWRAIQAAKRPLSPSEVLEEARLAVRATGIATVYRTLKLPPRGRKFSGPDLK